MFPVVVNVKEIMLRYIDWSNYFRNVLFLKVTDYLVIKDEQVFVIEEYANE